MKSSELVESEYVRFLIEFAWRACLSQATCSSVSIVYLPMDCFLFFPVFVHVLLEKIHTIDLPNSSFQNQVYSLGGIVIAIHLIQAFGMTVGSVSWMKRGAKILVKENIVNAIGASIGIVIGKYFWIADQYMIFKIFGSMNLIMVIVLSILLIVRRSVPQGSSWPSKAIWIFFPVGLIGGLAASWTSIGVGGLTSFALMLIVRPEIAVANGSVMMAVTSFITVILHLLTNQSIPFEIVIFCVPCVLIGGFAAPFFMMWVGQVFVRSFLPDRVSIFNSWEAHHDMEHINAYRVGQIIITASFIIISVHNAFHYVIL